MGNDRDRDDEPKGEWNSNREDPWSDAGSKFDSEAAFNDGTGFDDDGTGFDNDGSQQDSSGFGDVDGMENKTSTSVKQEQQQEEQLIPKTIRLSPTSTCGLLGLMNFGGGLFGGAVLGSISTTMDAVQRNYIRSPEFFPTLRAQTMRSAIQFGTWISIYTSSKCMAQVVRNKKDAGNSFIGGFIAGSVVTLNTRNPRVILASGLGNACLLSVFDLLQ